MRGSKTAVIKDFSLGLIEPDSGLDLPLGAARALQNVLPIGRHGLKRRAGTGLHTMGQDVLSTYYSEPLGGLGIALGSSKAYRISTAADLGAHGFSSPSLTGFADGPVSGGQGPLYMQSGGVAKYVTTGWSVGTWTSSAGTLPLSANGAIAYHGNRMWVAGVSGTASRLYFSDIGDPRIWSGGASGYVDIDPSTAGDITALCPCGPYLLVFKATRCYIVYDLSTGANRMLSGTLGVVGQTNVCQGDYGTAYFAATGRSNNTSDVVIYETDGSAINPVSTNLYQPGTLLGYGGGVLCVAGQSTEINAYVRQLGSWWRFAVGDVGSQVSAPTALARTRHTFFLSGSSGRLYDLDIDYINSSGGTNNDSDGTAVTCVWQGVDLDMGMPELRKRLRSIDVEGSGNGLSGGATKDGSGSAPSTVGLTFAPAASTIGSARVNSLGVARYWAPYITSTSTSAWTVRAVTLNYAGRRN